MDGLNGNAGQHCARRVGDGAGQNRFLRKEEGWQQKDGAEKEQWPDDGEPHEDLLQSCEMTTAIYTR